jgi:hypothetical protein
MGEHGTAPVVYQLRVWLQGVSPMVWRRLLVRSDSTIAELHQVLQIAFGWSDEHLHCWVELNKSSKSFIDTTSCLGIYWQS